METKKIQYPYLPEGRDFMYVSEDNSYMREAKRVAFERATDRRYLAGAVIVLNGNIVGRGALRSRIKNKRLIKLHRGGWCVRRIFRVKTGEKYWLCPGCCAPRNHSEPTAIRNAQRAEGNTIGADLYLWGHWWCCKDCWDAMISAGIKNVYLLEDSEILFNKGHPDNVIGRQFE